MTATNDAALMKKHGATPTPAMSTPPMAGPMMRDELMTTELSPTALARSSGPTISYTKLCRDGMSRATGTAGEPGEHPDHPHGDDVRGGEHAEDEREHRGDRLGDHQQLALVDAVGERARPGPEEQHRAELEPDGDAEVDAAAGEVQDEPVLRHRLHPGAAHRDDLAEEEQPVVVDVERAEGALQQAGVRRGGGDGHGASLPGGAPSRRRASAAEAASPPPWVEGRWAARHASGEVAAVRCVAGTPGRRG